MISPENLLDRCSILYSPEEVDSAVKLISSQISCVIEGKNPLVICIMNGGFFFASKLMLGFSFPLQFDYIHATRYKDNLTGDSLEWIKYPSLDIKGRTILLVDDILDEGVTLAEIAKWCTNAGAAEVYTAVLVDKQHDRKACKGLKADFTALQAPDAFLVGCGMDYKGYWRNLGGLYCLE